MNDSTNDGQSEVQVAAAQIPGQDVVPAAKIPQAAKTVRSAGGRGMALGLTVSSAILFVIGIFAPSFTMIPKLGNGYFEWLVRRFVSSDLEPRSFSLIGGIVHLFGDRDLFVGGVILVFSVIFPAAKLVTLGLSFRADQGSAERHLGWLEQLGKWSMLDVFVIAALVVCFKGFPGGSHVEVEWGIYVFAASVVLSMFATRAMRRWHGCDVAHSIARGSSGQT
jgi:paraquat-inducible protein A